METAVGIIVGGLITILTAIGVEYLRRPKLELSIENPALDRNNLGKPSRNLRLILRNAPLPLIARWMQRSAATQCRGEITFHHLDDGQNVFDRVMAVRWVKSPELVPEQVIDTHGTVQYYIQDFSKFSMDSRIDVYPGEQELLDVAIRFEGEPECYGWNNESYFHNWRNPNWRFLQHRFLVRVVITSSGQKCVRVFRLINDVQNLTDFRLTAAIAGDREKVQ